MERLFKWICRWNLFPPASYCFKMIYLKTWVEQNPTKLAVNSIMNYIAIGIILLHIIANKLLSKWVRLINEVH